MTNTNTTNTQLSTIRRLSVLATVIISGASVMVIELLGTRLIAPFDSPLYLKTRWQATITKERMSLY